MGVLAVLYAGLAQLAEHFTCNEDVVGSIPTSGSTHCLVLLDTIMCGSARRVSLFWRFVVNSLGRSARGALILLIALVVGVWVISRTVSSPSTAEAGTVGGGETTVAALSTTSTTAAPARDPKSVKVLMVNGTVTAGIAKLASKCVVAYDAMPPKNATTKPLATSAMYASPAAQQEAAAIASILGFTGQILQFPVDPGVRDYPTPAPEVMLIIGDDLGTSIRNLGCAQNPS